MRVRDFILNYWSTKKTVTIALVDSNQMLGEALKVILTDLKNEFSFLEQQRNLGNLAAMAADLQPQIVLVELFSVDANETLILKKFTTEHPNIKVVVYSASAEKEHVLEALKNGAVGYLLKRANVEAVIRALRVVAQGQYYLDPQVTPLLIGEVRRLHNLINSSELFSVYRSDPSPGLLNSREMEIVRLVTQGRSNRLIGEALEIKEKSVKNYVSRILSKLDLADRTQIALKAIKSGWVEL